MKRILTSLLLALLFMGGAIAQSVAYYSFSSVTGGTYAPLEGATKLLKSEQVKGIKFQTTLFNETDSMTFPYSAVATMAGIPIGFDFMFDGRTYDHFVAAGTGYILLGEGEEVELDGTDWFEGNVGLVPSPRIGVSSNSTWGGNYGIAGTSIAYKKEGSEGNRVLTVEFTGMTYEEETEEVTPGKFNYQVKLYEADNRIEFVFDEFTTENGSWCVGLRGKTTTHFRQPVAADWSETMQIQNGTNIWTDNTFPKGLKYTFSLPAQCEAPTEKIEDVVLTAMSDAVTVDVYVDTAGYAEGYLIIASENPINGSPEGGEYQEGDEVLGGKVLAAGNLTDFDRPSAMHPNSRVHFSFTHSDLKPNTTYYYAAYLSNFQCTDAKYTPTVSRSAKTRTEAADTLLVKRMTLDKVVFDVEANDKGEDILIAVTRTNGRDAVRNEIYKGLFGVAASDAEVGDTIWTTKEGVLGAKDTVFAVVLYTGPAKPDIVCPVELEDNSIYFFGAASRDGEGRYSSVYADASVLSPVKIPFEDRFENMLRGGIFGWNGTEGFELEGSASGISGAVSTMTANEEGQHQEDILTLPPMDFPTDSNVLLTVNYSLDPWDVEWVEGDSIVYEISLDGGKTFEKLKAVHRQSNSQVDQKVLITGYSGVEQAILRFRVVSYNTSVWNVSVSQVRVTGIALCDKPVYPGANTVYGGTVRLSWGASLNEETQWNVSYTVAEGESQWSEPVTVEEAPNYWLSGLEDNKLYRMRVRAVCGVGKVSEWTEKEFRTGRIPTFTEDFNNLPATGYDGELETPTYWNAGYFYYGIEDTLGLNSLYSGGYEGVDWKTDRTAVPGETNGSLAWKMNDLKYVHILEMPAVELIKADGSKLVFDAAYGKINPEGNLDTLAADTPEKHSMQLWVSVDSGYSVVTTAPIRTWDSAQLTALKDSTRIEIDLSDYEGVVVFAIGIFGTDNEEAGDYRLYIDNVGIINESPVARSLKVEDLGQTTASVSWVADKTVEEWLVKLESAQTDTLFATGSHRVDFTGLTAETDYIASVSHAYGQNDTAQWRSVNFKTGGAQCDEVMDLEVADVTKNSALLTWSGSAEKYRIRVRPVSETPGAWAYYTTETLSYPLTNLLNETEYEGGIQAICGQASGDTSAYVPFDAFTTLGVTCFAPHTLLVLETAPTAATICWTGEADRYQVAWFLRGSSTMAGSMMADNDTCTMEGLRYATRYEAKVRSVCSAGDSSDWSEPRYFETTERPACPVPTDLRVEAVTENSAMLLWTVNETVEDDVTGFMLRYRSTAVQVWDSVKDLTETSWQLKDLEPKTAYLWAVLSACMDGRYSGWGTQTRFETTGVGNEATDRSGLYIGTSKGQIHLMNPSAVMIERVRVYSTEGILLEDYTVRSNENVILTTGATMKIVVVEVESEGRFIRFKTLLP